MSEKEEKKEFIEPELIKFEEPLDVVTPGTQPIGSQTTSDRLASTLLTPSTLERVMNFGP